MNKEKGKHSARSRKPTTSQQLPQLHEVSRADPETDQRFLLTGKAELPDMVARRSGRSLNQAPIGNSVMLTTKQAAQRLGVHESTLRGWRMSHSGPGFVRYSARVIRYDERDVDEYIAKHWYDPSARASLEESINARQ